MTTKTHEELKRESFQLVKNHLNGTALFIIPTKTNSVPDYVIWWRNLSYPQMQHICKFYEITDITKAPEVVKYLACEYRYWYKDDDWPESRF